MRITEVGVIGGGQVAYAGDIAVITGLGAVAVGDRIDGDGTAACKGTTDRASLGTGTTKSADSVRLPARLPRPDLSTIVTATDPTDTSALFHALTEMAAQDPLINADFIGSGRARVLLFGEVQQQVLRDTLADEYGVATQFSPAELRHLERPIGTGSAMRNGFRIGIQALVGFRVQPAPRGAGLRYRLEVELGALPTSFHDAIRQTVQRSLQQGLFGWPMTDVCVTVTETAYSSVSSTAGDFRRLTPLPLFEALARAGTGVYEPLHRFDVEVPPDCVGPVLSALTRHEAEIEQSAPLGPGWQIRGQLPLRHIHAVRQALPGLTRGEAAWTAVPGDDRAVTGPAPTAERTDGNPLDEQAYLRHVRGW
jgi:ribosomal protection tetracycline resistance protein